MDNTLDKTSSNTEAAFQLGEAISRLESYALQESVPPTPLSVSKTISMMRNLIKTGFDLTPKKRKHQRQPPDKESVTRAVEFINTQRLFIEKLKEGTQAEKDLAQSFTSKIDAYNKTCDLRIQNCFDKEKGLAGFLFGLKKDPNDVPPKVALPHKVTVSKLYSQSSVSDGEKNAFANTAKSAGSTTITNQSAELFQMKVLSLLEQYGIASNPEARAHVKTSPIHAAIEIGSGKCTLTQTFSLFPGQTIVAKGDSALDPKTPAIASLFPETFSLKEESTQTGFPHPSQRAGWSLSHQLMPDNPQRVDLLGATADVLFKRTQVIDGLLPQGRLLKKAKALLAEKKNCFNANKAEMIALHKKLSESIMAAAPAETVTPDMISAIGKFYEALMTHPEPFGWLTETNHFIREIFIVKPHQHLFEAIIRGKDTDFGHCDANYRYNQCKRVIDVAVEEEHDRLRQQMKGVKLANEKIKLDYISSMGRIIGEGSKHVMLQYLSEDLIFEPPVLTPFECKVQAAAFNHLVDFLQELEAEVPQSMLDKMKREIQADIDVFSSENVYDVCHDLADYFKKRYESLIDAEFHDSDY